ncbi:MAG: efflux RND transporter periplasmic adaptor subunit [Gallionellaceae bacterium]|nr:efflux RND transporter periplasmic adaptor subunit [Gallionellaceae bacterium]
MKRSFIFMLLPIALVACGKKEEVAQVKVERPASTIVIGTGSANNSNIYSGEIRARNEVALGFRLGGKIVARLVDAGTVVKAGQVLARLDATDTALQESSASAQYRLAEDEVKRFRELRAKGFVSQSALDAKEAALKSAAAQAGLAHNQAGYTNLVAERSGVVSATLAEVGQVVAAGQAVVRVAQDGEREVAVAIPESRYASLKVGMAAEVELSVDNGETKKYNGRLRELSPAADPASRTYPARVLLTNGDASLALGMTAHVRFSASEKNKGFLVPVSAIFQQGEQAAVWVVGADRAVRLRPVTVAAYRDEGAQISSGVAEGERIISAGVHKLTAGDKVQIAEGGKAQ